MQSTLDSSIKTAFDHQNASERQASHNSEQKSISEAMHPDSFDRALRTRDACALAIFLGWLVAISSIGIGVHTILSWSPIDPYFIGKEVLLGTGIFCFRPKYPLNMNVWAHKAYALPKYVPNLITLGLTTAITVLLDSMSYVHSTTLRWALAREDRLQKNSNLRLFSCAKSHFPNKWYINVISVLSLSIIYGGVALLVTEADILSLCGQVTEPAPSIEKGILVFNGWGIMTLGVGLLLQSVICTCSLYKSAIVPTWNSHPMINARAYSWWTSCSENLDGLNLCKSTPLTPTANESPFLPVLDKPPMAPTPNSKSSEKGPISFVQPLTASSPGSSPSWPQARQQSMLSTLPRACMIRYVVWAYFGAFASWSIVLGTVGSATGRLIPSDTIANGTNSSWETSAIVEVVYPGADNFRYRHDWIGLLIQIVAQSFIVLGLHCIELIANVSRDESCWRKAASVGVEMKGSAIMTFLSSWQSMTLMILKSVTQWVFGKAFTADISVIMSLFPLITMAGLFLLSAVFTEYMIRRKPKGYQPVTYGDIRRLARFIDEWDDTRIFWGDKGEIDNGIRQAGTAGHRLCDVHPDAPYIGLA